MSQDNNNKGNFGPSDKSVKECLDILNQRCSPAQKSDGIAYLETLSDQGILDAIRPFAAYFGTPMHVFEKNIQSMKKDAFEILGGKKVN